MRVISGSAKGHRLKCISGRNTRPTLDRVKESVFNIIVNYIYDCNCLDLFSGTGNLGIEALSRGARFCTMVEHNNMCINIIKENLVHTKLSDKAKVLRDDVLDALRKLNDKFDLIFMDPPYNKDKIIPTLELIAQRDILSENGLIVVERDASDDIEGQSYFTIIREQTYGDTVVSFLKSEKKS